MTCSETRLQSMLWQNGTLVLLDQTKLPLQEELIECRDYRRVAEAIRRLEVRGAPAIGAAAAFGLVLGAASSWWTTSTKLLAWRGTTAFAARS